MEIDGKEYHNRAILVICQVYLEDMEKDLAAGTSVHEARKKIVRKHPTEIQDIMKLILEYPEKGYIPIFRMHMARKAEQRSLR